MAKNNALRHTWFTAVSLRGHSDEQKASVLVHWEKLGCCHISRGKCSPVLEVGADNLSPGHSSSAGHSRKSSTKQLPYAAAMYPKGFLNWNIPMTKVSFRAYFNSECYHRTSFRSSHRTTCLAQWKQFDQWEYCYWNVQPDLMTCITKEWAEESAWDGEELKLWLSNTLNFQQSLQTCSTLNKAAYHRRRCWPVEKFITKATVLY